MNESVARPCVQYILAALEYAIVLSFTIPLFLYRQKYFPFFYLRCQSLIKPTMSKYLNSPIRSVVISLLPVCLLFKKCWSLIHTGVHLHTSVFPPTHRGLAFDVWQLSIGQIGIEERVQRAVPFSVLFVVGQLSSEVVSRRLLRQ